MDYIEYPLSIFCALFPDLADFIPPFIRFSGDDLYVVRFDGRRIEFGYSSDEWLIC